MNLGRVEDAMRASVWQELPGYQAADAATDSLCVVIQQVKLEPYRGDGSPPASYVRTKALMYLSLLALRATRAAMAVIASGYEAESMGYKRTLTEAHSRARRVHEDESGEYARTWLQGRAGKAGKAVSGYSPDDLWEMLSHSSHADHRAVENFLAISEPDGSTKLILGPERRFEVSNATLATFAGETRDIANLLATQQGLKYPTSPNLTR